MKVEVATVSINDITTLKVLLVPENEKELSFLMDAVDKCEGYEVSASTEIRVDI